MNAHNKSALSLVGELALLMLKMIGWALLLIVKGLILVFQGLDTLLKNSLK